MFNFTFTSLVRNTASIQSTAYLTHTTTESLKGFCQMEIEVAFPLHSYHTVY